MIKKQLKVFIDLYATVKVSILAELRKDSIYLRGDQYVSKALRKWMQTGLNKPSNSSSTIAEHLLNNIDCSKNYNDSRFSIISKARNLYHLSVLESLFIKTFKPKLCKQKYVYKSNLYKLL